MINDFTRKLRLRERLGNPNISIGLLYSLFLFLMEQDLQDIQDSDVGQVQHQKNGDHEAALHDL